RRGGILRRPRRPPAGGSRRAAGSSAGSRRAARRGIRHPVHPCSKSARSSTMRRPSRRLAALTPALIFALWGASCDGASPEVRVGSKKFTESVVLGEIVTQVLRSTGKIGRAHV